MCSTGSTGMSGLGWGDDGEGGQDRWFVQEAGAIKGSV
jgi:hypothetical protein